MLGPQEKGTRKVALVGHQGDEVWNWRPKKGVGMSGMEKGERHKGVLFGYGDGN